MKKVFNYILCAMAILALASCNKEKTSDTPISPDDQKTHIENTANAIMDALALDNWKSDFDFAKSAFNEVSGLFADEVKSEPKVKGEVDVNALKQWVGDLQQLWGTFVSEDPEGKISDYHTMLLMIKLSEATGHFTLNQDNVIVKEEGQFDDFVLTATLAGEQVSIQAKAVDSDALVSVYSSMKIGADHYEYEEYQVYVPSSLSINILRGTSRFAGLDIAMNFVDANRNLEVDPDLDSFSASAEFGVSILTVKLPKVTYTPGNASVSSGIYASGKLIFAEEANVTMDFAKNGDESIAGVEPKSANLYLDLAGLTQVRLSVPNYQNFMDASSIIGKTEGKTQAEVKNAVDTFNATFGAGIYYDYSSTLQASFLFIVVPQEVDGGATIYKAVPAIRFSDGTTVSAEDFLENNLSSVYQSVAAWVSGILAYVMAGDGAEVE